MMLPVVLAVGDQIHRSVGCKHMIVLALVQASMQLSLSRVVRNASTLGSAIR